MDIYKGFECHPTVCAVGSEYQIIVPVKFNMLFSVRVGDYKRRREVKHRRFCSVLGAERKVLQCLNKLRFFTFGSNN